MPFIPNEPIVPSANDAKLARTAIPRITPGRSLELRGTKGGRSIKLPVSASRLLLSILEQMAAGNAVTLTTLEKELTTQQAADLLGVSRPFVVAQMDEGKLPFRKVGTHRRVLVADVLDYKRRMRAAREEALSELTAEAQRLGLGY